MKKYLLKHTKLLIFAITALLASAIIDVAFAFIIRDIVDATSSKETLISSITIGVFFLILAVALSFVRKYAEHLYVRSTLVTLKNDLFKAHMSQNYPTYNRQNTANYISTINNDILILESDYVLNILEIVDNIFIFIISLTSIILINYQVTITIIGLSFLPMLFPYIFRNKLNHLKTTYSNNVSKFTATSKDLYSGYEVIKTHIALNNMTQTFKNDNFALENSKFKYIILEGFVGNLSQAFGHLMHLSAIGVGACFVMNDQLTMGSLVAILQLMTFIVSPAVQISNRFSKLQAVKGIKEKIVHDLSDDQKSDDQKPDGHQKISFEKHIQLNEVSFSYDNFTTAIKNINLTFEKGKKYALIGKSGSGKSTLLKLLLNYFDLSNGDIKIDGHALCHLTDRVLYEHIAIIHQEVFIFDDTIKNNITLLSDYTNEAIWNVLKKVNLFDKVNTLPKGINTPLSEGGNIFSGGEKQRIAIARTLIKESPILLLDEITSALDVQTTQLIESTLLEDKHQTLIAITHKISPDILKKYHEIIIMDQGEILAKGSFVSLQNHEFFKQQI